MKYTIDEFLSKLPLPANDKWKDGVKLVFFAPRGTDYQTFHEQDEFYFIARGTAKIVIDQEAFDCATGDAFFVPKHVPHHFDDFTDDFATWAVFF